MSESEEPHWLVKQIDELYGSTHGLKFAEITSTPLPGDEPERVALWARYWREQQFHTANPIGSSRLVEVALRQSTAGGSARDLFKGLLLVLGADPPVTARLAFFLQHLCRAPLWEDSLADAYDFAGGVPPQVTPAQALLLVRLARDRSLYDPDAIARLSQRIPREYAADLRHAFPEDVRE